MTGVEGIVELNFFYRIHETPYTNFRPIAFHISKYLFYFCYFHCNNSSILFSKIGKNASLRILPFCLNLNICTNLIQINFSLRFASERDCINQDLFLFQLSSTTCDIFLQLFLERLQIGCQQVGTM